MFSSDRKCAMIFVFCYLLLAFVQRMLNPKGESDFSIALGPFLDAGPVLEAYSDGTEEPREKKKYRGEKMLSQKCRREGERQGREDPGHTR